MFFISGGFSTYAPLASILDPTRQQLKQPLDLALESKAQSKSLEKWISHTPPLKGRKLALRSSNPLENEAEKIIMKLLQAALSP